MASECLDMSKLDWDDTELAIAYDKSVKLNQKKGSSKKGSHSRNWSVGDFCCVLYPEDNLLYEAKIISIDDSNCTVMFLGYKDVLEVEISTLKKSKGKRSRKGQLQDAKHYFSKEGKVIESESDSTEVKGLRKQSVARETEHSMNSAPNYMTASNQHASLPVPPHSFSVPPNTMFPAPPPVPDVSSVQDPSIYSMLSAWYLAGYYTGLHEAKNRQFSQPMNCNRCCHH